MAKILTINDKTHLFAIAAHKSEAWLKIKGVPAVKRRAHAAGFKNGYLQAMADLKKRGYLATKD